MQVEKIHRSPSWAQDESPIVLSEIFSDTTSVALWRRASQPNIQDYFENVFSRLGLGLNGVFEIDSLKQQLDLALPDDKAKQDVVEDIFLLSDMLTCLFNCQSVGLRLVPLTSAMCPSFHIDNIPVRLVNTYLGTGTEWLPLEALSETKPMSHNPHTTKTKFGKYYEKTSIQTLNAFDVGLLKGKAWQGHEHLGAVHRSCQLDEADRRVLLTLDPM